LRSTDVVFAALPFTHVLGLNIVLLPYLRTGATVVLQPRWDPVEALDLIERHRVTHIVGVPPMWAAWAELADRGSNPMRSVTFARAGASSLHASVAGAVHEAFGLELVQGYGLTETAGTVTLEPAARLRPGSVGRPLPGVELQLVENGEPVEPGDRGEVWIRAPSVFAGYLDDPAATAEVLVTGGWCRSGDIGIQDDDGSLYLVGRSKDLINVSGFNVYPAEVEAVLEQHAGIRAAVVVGEPHALTGECVVAYVIAPGGLDPDDVTAHCQQRLSRYKVPVSMHLVDRLPLTNIGKRVRSRLR
jgi:long-chain acyl-CoA synthetase